MDFIINNWFLTLAAIAVVAVIVVAVVKFSNLPTEAQINKVKEWLVYACMEAEKELGGKTGKLKLRMVYDMFLTKFPWLAKVVSFEQFSLYVDDALAKFKEMLKTNEAVKELVEQK